VTPCSRNLNHRWSEQLHAPAALLPGKCPTYSFNGRVCGPQSPSGQSGEEIKLLPLRYRTTIPRGSLCLDYPAAENCTALFCVITQRVMVISYRSFGTACRFHLQGSSWSQHAFQRRWYEHVDLYGVCAIRLESLSVPLREPQPRYEYK
jgi:hypothetical protein